MNIAIDVSPLQTGHKVRGVGFYLKNLKASLQQFFPDNKYTFFTQEQNIPKNIDVIHYPYFEPFFVTLPFFKKAKTIVTVHDVTPIVFQEHFPAGVKGFVKWQVQKVLVKNVDAIITDSENSKKDIVRIVGVAEEKVHVVYLAAGEEFKPITNYELQIKQLKKKYNLPEKFVLYVGDVTWNKNLPRLVEAVQKINVPLVMVGKALVNKEYDAANPWNKDLVAVQKLIKNDKNIIPLGFVSTEDLVFLYNKATVFLMPSLYEGFGLPILEAMSCGCPVVTTREGSLPEVAGEAAYFVDAYSVDNIAKGIYKVFSEDTLQHDLSKKGLAQVKKFSWKKTAQQTMEFYKEVYETKNN